MQDTGNKSSVKRAATTIKNKHINISSLLYQNPMVTGKQKSTIDTQTNKIKQSKHNAKDKPQEENRNKSKNKSKTINKMAIRTYIPVITLNGNGL